MHVCTETYKQNISLTRTHLHHNIPFHKTHSARYIITLYVHHYYTQEKHKKPVCVCIQVFCSSPKSSSISGEALSSRPRYVIWWSVRVRRDRGTMQGLDCVWPLPAREVSRLPRCGELMSLCVEKCVCVCVCVYRMGKMMLCTWTFCPRPKWVTDTHVNTLSQVSRLYYIEWWIIAALLSPKPTRLMSLYMCHRNEGNCTLSLPLYHSVVIAGILCGVRYA